MYKIRYLPTGNVFELPDNTAKNLKESFPNDYKILAKNGRKYNDKVVCKVNDSKGSIYSKVVERS